MVAPMNVEDWTLAPIGDGTSTLVAGRDFAISSATGDMERGAVHGLLHDDRRFLDTWAVRVPGHELRALASAMPMPFHAVYVARLHDGEGRPLPLLVVRRRWVAHGMRETIEIHSSARESTRLEVTVEVGADFQHLFEVKAGITSDDHGVVAPRADGTSGVVISHPERDGSFETVITAQPEPTAIGDDGWTWCFDIDPHDRAVASVVVEPRVAGRPHGDEADGEAEDVDERTRRRFESWRDEVPEVVSRDPRLSVAVRRSLEDLASLRIFDTAHPELAVVAAGAPWFMALFGRDSLLTAYMAIPFAPDLARGVLHELAELQGTIDDPASGEEPGKILHELRSHGGGGPFSERSRYYGSVDATPLYVLVAAEAVRWGAVSTADRQWLVPAIDAAIGWIRDRGDTDGDGFVDYRPHDEGLDNQGWKDSWDGVNSADGSYPTAPIALVEVQAYVYGALLGAAEMYRSFDRPADVTRCTREASRLKAAFNDAFWDDRGWFVQALDGQGRQVDSLGSNPGHALWTGIAHRPLAERYLDALEGDEMWSGWGLRTLATTMGAYDPLSYHNGSVWPHDTALALAGAARYGRWGLVDRLSDGLLDAAMHFGGRLPELFSGVSRDLVPVPVAYPGSCSPQAWASAAVLLVLRTNLGLDADMANRTVVVNPRGRIAADMSCTRLAVGGRHLSISVADGSLVADADGLEVRDLRP